MPVISEIRGREILDSRGNPTVESHAAFGVSARAEIARS
jgi:enolase